MHNSSVRAGFTLIELAIVLVVIGLIVGVVFVGQELIKQSQIRSIYTDIDKFNIAVSLFKNKYNCLPGDCLNATDYFGTAHANPVTCISTIGTGTQTCNGDGDGKVEDPYYGDATEFHRFWQQLSAAGLIEGQYTGVVTPDCYMGDICNQPGVNEPAFKYPGAGAYIDYLGRSDPDGVLFEYGFHAYIIGAIRDHLWANNPAVAPNDALLIDNKIDDGMPGMGAVQTYTPSFTPSIGCASSADPTTATYMKSDARLCVMIIKTPY